MNGQIMMNEEVFAVKKSRGALVLAGLLVCALALIITKEISLPRALIVGGALAYGVLLMTRGLRLSEVVAYTLIAYLPFSKKIGEDFGHFGSAFNFVNILTGLFILAWLLKKREAGEPLLEKTSCDLPLTIFLGIGALSILRGSLYGTEYLTYAVVEYIRRWIIPIFLYFLTFNTVKDKETIKNLVVLIIAATVMVGLMAMYDYREADRGDLDDGRVEGVAGDPNLLAAFFNYYMFLPLSFFLMNIKSWKRAAWLVPFLICFRGMMVAFSRAGYLAFAAGLYAVIFFRNKFLFLVLLAATVFLILNPVYLPGGIRYRIGQTFEKPPGMEQPAGINTVRSIEKDIDPSAAQRLRVWRGGLWMIREHPVLGVGYNLFERKIQHYWPGLGAIDAHNSYILIAAEMGIPALCVFLWIIALLFWNAQRLYRLSGDSFARALALGFIGGIAGFLVSNFFGSRLDSHEVSSYFWILAAFVMRLEKGSIKNQELRIKD